MVSKNYDWEGGARLEEHTKKKHSILSKYFREYLLTRCQLPQQKKFRIVIVDGFSGGGLYECGSYGSPLIFIDTLVKTAEEINIHRTAKGLDIIQIECLLLLNDAQESAINLLRQNIAPLLSGARETAKNIHVDAEFFNGPFETVYEDIKDRLESARCSNVFFNLDQCGYSHVTSRIIRDIISSWRSAEVLLTFMIDSVLAFLSPNNKAPSVPLEPEMRQEIDILLSEGNEVYGKKAWLAKSEKIVYTHFRNCAPFVSPFSINNPDGWRYWLMHFASSYRARQVYNNVLHCDGDTQAHFGRSGLKMLSYDPQSDGKLYLFDESSRESAKEDLYDDIPKLIAASGDVLGVEEFYKTAYSETPAHSDDIHEMIIENPDLVVVTESGGERRKPHTIKIGDTLKLKSQKSMIFMFSAEAKES